jgi:hypothetical protein
MWIRKQLFLKSFGCFLLSLRTHLLDPVTFELADALCEFSPTAPLETLECFVVDALPPLPRLFCAARFCGSSFSTATSRARAAVPHTCEGFEVLLDGITRLVEVLLLFFLVEGISVSWILLQE